MNEPTIVIVGAGPRGISTLERLGSYVHDAGYSEPVTVHIIDDTEIGAGAIWRTDQTRTLCMNTMAHGVTLFTEPGATVQSSVAVGPTMYEWARIMRGDLDNDVDGPVPPPHVDAYHEVEPDSRILRDYHEEIREMREQSHPTRALYGEYLRWCFALTLHRLPDNIKVIPHVARVTQVTGAHGTDTFTLSTGETITADAAALALGWLSPAPTAEERNFAEFTAAHDTTVWVASGNPVEQALDVVPTSGTVLVRGLGMGFFDVMAMLTIDRGGEFIPDPAARSGLRYQPSGREPHLAVSSGRGWPYLAKPQYGSMPPAAHLPRTRQVIAELLAGEPGAASIDYDTQVWPSIMRDSHEAYYLTLQRVRPTAIDAPAEEITRIVERCTDLDELNEAFGKVVPETTDRFDLLAEADPLAPSVIENDFTVEELTDYIAHELTADLRDSEGGLDSPRKAGLAVIGAARKPSSILGTPGRYTEASRRNTYQLIRRLGQMAGSGPPAFRSQQLIALVDAGLVSFIGARPVVTTDTTTGEFVMTSPTTQGIEVRSTTLIDAWLHQPDVRSPHDPLALSIHDAGRVRPYQLRDPEGSSVDSGSPEVEAGTGRLVHLDGTVDPRLHALGIPLYDVRADTTISPLPGTDALLLQETDLVARSLFTVITTA